MFKRSLFTFLFTLLLSSSLLAATIKVAVIAPEGTNWSKNLKKMAKEVAKQTNNKVKLKFYFGGSQGDEPDVLRKIRVGQLHGGIFTGKTLGDINGDVRVLELPFNFDSNLKKAASVMHAMAPYFDQGFAKSDFINLGFTEIGMVYFVSQKKIESLDGLKGVKIWSWDGDALVEAIMKNMNLVSVPLALPDVLSSLTTGIIEAAYAPALGIVAFQWNTKVKYLLDFPLAYSVGAFLISEKGFKKIPAQYRETVKKITAQYLQQVEQGNRQDNEQALKSMRSTGVEFINFSEKDIKQAERIRQQTISSLKGKLFSQDALNRLEALRK